MKVPVEGIGRVNLCIKTNRRAHNVHLSNVLWVPDLTTNLVSVHCLRRKGFITAFSRKECNLVTENGHEAIGSYRRGQYMLNNQGSFQNKNEKKQHNGVKACKPAGIEVELCIHGWHRKLAHQNLADIRHTVKKGLLKSMKCNHSDDCKPCLRGKMARKLFKKSRTKAKEPIDCIVSDVCGPMQVESIDGKRYLLTFTDMYSKHTVKFFN